MSRKFLKYSLPSLKTPNNGRSVRCVAPPLLVSYLGLDSLQPDGTEKLLKVPLRGTFKSFSGFYISAKRWI